MSSSHYSFEVETEGENCARNLTEDVSRLVSKSGAITGLVTVSVRSTTSSVILCEDEKGHLSDMVDTMGRIAPATQKYRHDDAWGDGNGRSHVKAVLAGQSVTIPLDDGKMVTGTWQSIFLMEFDTRPRRRAVDVTVLW